MPTSARLRDRLKLALEGVATAAEAMTVTAVQVRRHVELNAAGAWARNVELGDVVETLTIRYSGSLSPALAPEAPSEPQDSATEQPDSERLTGDYADVLTELLRRARPGDRVDIAPTGQLSPGITVPPGLNQAALLAEAVSIADEELGRKLMPVTVWVLE